MPRDIYLVSPTPVTMTALVAAAQRVDDSLVLRPLYMGAALQLLDAEDVAVLTIENSRLLEDSSDLARLAPDLRLLDLRLPDLQLPDSGRPDDELWWMDATAPWGPAGLAGVEIVAQLAHVLGGATVVRDGS